MPDLIDFPALFERFQRLGTGPKAELRRAGRPSDLEDYPAVYRLYQGRPLNKGLLRVAFCLPWVGQAETPPPLGAQFATAGISEQRLFQVMRSNYPNDLIQFRRLLQQVEPIADWRQLGPFLLRWSGDDKRRLLEEYYLRAASANSSP